MPGCGTFSLHDVGSYILFPNFALRIDDSVDNLVSYKSIGRSETVELDYAQPRASIASSIILPPPPPTLQWGPDAVALRFGIFPSPVPATREPRGTYAFQRVRGEQGRKGEREKGKKKGEREKGKKKGERAPSEGACAVAVLLAVHRFPRGGV